MTFWQGLGERIAAASGTPFAAQDRITLGGGCINRCYRLRGEPFDVFVKLNGLDRLVMFEAEAAALIELAASDTVRVPQPLCWGTLDQHAYLVLEYLALGRLDDSTQAVLGRQLAALHRIPKSYFGWTADNTIGTTPQLNSRTTDWAAFWRDQRLGYQLELAARSGHNGHYGSLMAKGERLLAKLDRFFSDYPVTPSLLHGDLWSGNAAAAGGEPVLYDPASYYGDREADLAMTELFGGFSNAFYAAYNKAYPVHEGYPSRRVLYNLYHVLNHLNLFGGGYQAQAEAMLDRLLQ